ncbi:MAG: TIGR02679 family protein [Phycisphaeraceae bacterium]
MDGNTRLRQALASEHLSWLVSRLRRRLENGTYQPDSTLRLTNPSPEQRQACDRLLGRKPSSGGALTVRPDQLERVLIEGELASNLREAVEVVSGPLVDRRGQRRRIEAAWRELYDRHRPAVADHQTALGWYEQIWEQGVLRRLSGKSVEQAGRLLDQAVRVVQRLPAQGISLAELAAECCGDSHALDPARPVGTLAVRAAAVLGDVQLRRTASSRRRAWDAVGVICDELSAPVLVLNLPASGAGVTSQLLQISAAAGEPCRITVRQLLRHPPTFVSLARDGVVFVCENPTVVAAAAHQLGAAAWPLVCIDGQPTTAARLLLNLLSGAGATLHYHGDFDWGGVRIANRIIADHQAVPWRMSTTDYIAAAASGGRELRGSAVPAMWDHGLSAAMLDRGVAVHEERVVPTLIADLRSPPK